MDVVWDAGTYDCRKSELRTHGRNHRGHFLVATAWCKVWRLVQNNYRPHGTSYWAHRWLPFFCRAWHVTRVVDQCRHCYLRRDVAIAPESVRSLKPISFVQWSSLYLNSLVYFSDAKQDGFSWAPARRGPGAWKGQWNIYVLCWR
jgi:hypothetical protein